jgi:hypothetical protein
MVRDFCPRRPEVSLDDGLAETFAWFAARRERAAIR